MYTPIAEIRNPPAQHSAAVNIARRGPPSSTQRPNTAEETPRKKIASEKIQPRSVSFQSSGVDSVTPRSFVIGRLNTLNAYAWPIHRCTQSVAGGTIHRQYLGLAIVWLRSRKFIAVLIEFAEVALHSFSVQLCPAPSVRLHAMHIAAWNWVNQQIVPLH